MSIKAKGKNRKMRCIRCNYYLILLAFIPENIKREVLQEISRFLESNLP